MIKSKRLYTYLKWFLWLLFIQFILINVSASIYAYKFTHFFKGDPPPYSEHNIFIKTWKLFTGPSFYRPDEKETPNFPYQEIFLKTKDNISINSWYAPSDSSKTCIILFHAISTDKTYLINQAEEFKNMGYSVLLPDFRGHGKSGNSYTTFGAYETSEVQCSISFAKSMGNKKIILYGFSMGSIAIMKFIHDFNIQPDGIIIEGPFASLHHLLRSRARALGFPSEPFATLVTFWISVERHFNGFNLQGAEYAKMIHCPVLLAWGLKDRYINISDILTIYNNIPSINKKIIIYPDADHESYLQTDPLMWENETRKFLQTIQ